MTEKQYSAHEWLNEAYWMEKTELRSLEETMERLKPDDGAIDYSKDRIQNGNSNAQQARLENYVIACENVDKLKTKIEHLKRTRQAVILSLEDSIKRTVLQDFYINRLKACAIGKRTGYAERTCYRIRDRALDEIYEKIKEYDD